MAWKRVDLWVIGVLALVASMAGLNELVVMFGAGLVVLLLYMVRRPPRMVLPLLLLEIPFFSEANVRIFLVFLKIGAVLYGSGYVLFAFLDSELVAKGLLSRTQLVDAIAVGQFTPGPVFSSVTFIGWQVNGFYGAVMATVAVFLPSFVFVALSNPLLPRMRRSKLFSAFLDGVNAAAVALILTVCIAFARETVSDWRTAMIAGLSLVVTFGFRKVNTVFVIMGSGLAGYALWTLFK